MLDAPSRLRSRALAAGLVTLTVSAGAVVLGSGGAVGAPAATNPFADAGGFSVYVRGDATLGNSEIEGALAVGGTLDAAAPGTRLPIMHKVAGTSLYDIPTIDGDPTRLLAGAVSPSSGIIDVAGHDGDSGASWGFAKIIEPDEPAWVFSERGGYTQYRLAQPGSESNGPTVDARNQPWATEGRSSMIAAGGSVAEYVETGIGFDATAACLTDLAGSASIHQVTVTDDGGKARLDLTGGVVNVLDYADLFVSGGSFASQITYVDDTPAADTPVIVRVGAGTTAVRGIEFGTSGEYPRYVMWDLSEVAGPVTLTDKQGGTGRVDGSIFAPFAALTLRVGPLDGQVIADTLITPSGTGELHAYMFASTLACETPTGTSTPDPTSSSTPDPTPSTGATPHVGGAPGRGASPAPSVTPSGSLDSDPETSAEPEVSLTADATPDPTPAADASVGPGSGSDAGSVTATGTGAGSDAAATTALARTGLNATALGGIAAGLGAIGMVLLIAASRRRA